MASHFFDTFSYSGKTLKMTRGFLDVINFGAPDLTRRFSFMDIGARGGIPWPWSKLPSELLSLVLVEPDPEEASKLRRGLGPTESGVVVPAALWRNDTEVTLYLNRWPATSSLYAANRIYLNQFPESGRFDPVRTIPVRAHAIDSLAADGVLPPLDFVKIDVQGAELPILEGGGKNFRVRINRIRGRS